MQHFLGLNVGVRTFLPFADAAIFVSARPSNFREGRGVAAQFPKSGHGVSAANPAFEVSNIAIVDGVTLKPEENDHETLRWN